MLHQFSWSWVVFACSSSSEFHQHHLRLSISSTLLKSVQKISSFSSLIWCFQNMFSHFDSPLFTTICFTHHCTDTVAAQLSSVCVGGTAINETKTKKSKLLCSFFIWKRKSWYQHVHTLSHNFKNRQSTNSWNKWIYLLRKLPISSASISETENLLEVLPFGS